MQKKPYMIVLSYYVFHIIGIYSAAQFRIVLTINSRNTGIEYDRNDQREYYAGFLSLSIPFLSMRMPPLQNHFVLSIAILKELMG